MSNPAIVSCIAFGALAVAQCPARAGEVYVTSFASPPFSVGADTVRNYDGWTGSSAHVGKALSGVLSESQHGVIGIGNAAYIGGNPARVNGVTNKSVFLRRVVNTDPVALGQEVATFGVIFGIKDSTASSSYRRDNFEFLIYNNNSQLLGGIQFDNNRIDSLTGLPLRAIYLLSWNGSGFVYSNTGYTFLPETLELLDRFPRRRAFVSGSRVLHRPQRQKPGLRVGPDAGGKHLSFEHRHLPGRQLHAL
jgi:hypothetical protein